MKYTALALVTDSVIKSSLEEYLTRSCHRAGLSLELHSVTNDCKSYVERFKAHQNIITWNCRMPHEWMTNKGKNLLFIENSLLMQRSGIFVDAGGFYSNSNLCRDKSWMEENDEQRERVPTKHTKGTKFELTGKAMEDFVRRQLGWVSALEVDGEGASVVDYTYCGAAWQVRVGYPQPEVELVYAKQGSEPVGDSGDPYNGYDRFGRTVDLRWQSSADGAQLERIQYGFDRDSRRTWRERTITTGEDNAYCYDGLSQVVKDTRGNLNLNQTAISAVPVTQENWDYDPTGNWRAYETRASGSVTLDQHRVHDKGNRLTQIEGDPNPILLDRAGRMRQLPPDASGDWNESLELKWDAWGRITQVKQVSDSEVLGSYTYDGLTRRITRAVDSVVQHSYFSDAWRPLEERKNSETDASAQYLWGARHRDDLVRRDRDSDDDGELNETRYVLMDYYSPASIVAETGEVTERYAFSAFGIRRILAPDFSTRSTSECAWEFAFQGQFLDTESGLLNYGYRYYSPCLGRWTTKDPIVEKGGWNLFAATDNRIINTVDLFGLLPGAPGHKTPEAAAVAACSEFASKSTVEQTEYGGVIARCPGTCQKDAYYIYSSVKGTEKHVWPSQLAAENEAVVQNGCVSVAIWHTHPGALPTNNSLNARLMAFYENKNQDAFSPFDVIVLNGDNFARKPLTGFLCSPPWVCSQIRKGK